MPKFEEKSERGPVGHLLRSTLRFDPDAPRAERDDAISAITRFAGVIDGLAATMEAALAGARRRDRSLILRARCVPVGRRCERGWRRDLR